MDFDFTPEQEAFRKEVQQWLEQNLPDDLRGRAFAASRADREEVRKLRTWQKRMYEAGYVGMDWPREVGGRGATLVEQVILYQELARAASRSGPSARSRARRSSTRSSSTPSGCPSRTSWASRTRGGAWP